MQLSFGMFQADEQAWVETIKSVPFGGTVRISTMDWLGQSEYLKQTIYWSSLSSAISEVRAFYLLMLLFIALNRPGCCDNYFYVLIPILEFVFNHQKNAILGTMSGSF